MLDFNTYTQGWAETFCASEQATIQPHLSGTDQECWGSMYNTGEFGAGNNFENVGA